MKNNKSNRQLIKQLNSLIQLDFDAGLAYEKAIEAIDLVTVKTKLRAFRRDHERHITELSAAVIRLGGEPVELHRDFKGFVIEGFTRIRSTTGTAGALRAMRGNEGLTNTKYARALKWEMPSPIQALIEKNREDEARHLEYIENAIDEKVWLQGKRAA